MKKTSKRYLLLLSICILGICVNLFAHSDTNIGNYTSIDTYWAQEHASHDNKFDFTHIQHIHGPKEKQHFAEISRIEDKKEEDGNPLFLTKPLKYVGFISVLLQKWSFEHSLSRFHSGFTSYPAYRNLLPNKKYIAFQVFRI